MAVVAALVAPALARVPVSAQGSSTPAPFGGVTTVVRPLPEWPGPRSAEVPAGVAAPPGIPAIAWEWPIPGGEGQREPAGPAVRAEAGRAAGAAGTEQGGSPAAAGQSPPTGEADVGRAAAAVAAAWAVAADLEGLDLRLAVLDRERAETAAAPGAADPLYTASLAKLVLAVDMIDRRREQGLAVGEPDLELIRRALGPSDDSAMNVLWSRFDGAHAASRLAARLGLTATTDPADPTQWGEMRVSAADHLLIYGHVLDLPGPDRDLLVDALAAAPDIARDGFAQDFGLLAGDLDAGRAAAKQGWMCCFGQRYHLHSVGLLGPDQRFVVALLSTAPQAPGWDEARAHLDEVAGAIGEVLASAA